MQSLYTIHVNQQGQISVDVFSYRRQTPHGWLSYFAVTPSTAKRLRRLYAKFTRRFYVSKEWSSGRWKMYKDWRDADLARKGTRVVPPSLDSLATSGR